MGLENKTVLITRGWEQAAGFIAELERRGGKAVLLPMINIHDPRSLEECDRALQEIRNYNGLIFTSTNGVEKFFQRCELKSVGTATLRQCEVYAVGVKTKEAVEERGLRVKAIPEEYSSAGLAEYFRSMDLQGKRFLYPRGDLGKADLIKSLLRQGATVDPVVVYVTSGPEEIGAGLVYRKLVEGDIDVITFASPSAATNFVKLFPPEKMALMHKRTRIAVIGPTTLECMESLRMKVDIVAKQATIDGLLDAIEEYYSV